MAVETHSSGEHMVQFYEHESELVAAVGPYLVAGVGGGEAAIVIATEKHRDAFAAFLERNGVDPAPGAVVWLDAATTLSQFMSDGEIDRDAFARVVGGLLREAGESGRGVRAYGEMVAVLWEAGDVLAAIELETLWNELAGMLTFSLFCAYPAASVSTPEHAHALHQVCHLHSAVFAPVGEGASAGWSEGSVLSARFPPAREAPGQARRLLVDALRQRGCEAASIDAAALVLSELASNAVRHGGSPFTVRIALESSTLRAEVADQSPLPEREGALRARYPHGLAVVDSVCARWGVEATTDGKVVWAELAL